MIYASTGLRRNEVLNLKFSEVDFAKRMIIPNREANNTKNTWITFFNEEAEKILIKDAAAIPYFVFRMLIAHHNKVKGLKVTDKGNIYITNTWANVWIDQ